MYGSVFEAVSVRQARVALDHFFSDVELVVNTIASFDPQHLPNSQELAV